MGRRVAFRTGRRLTGGAASGSFIPFNPTTGVTSATNIIRLDYTNIVLDGGGKVGPWLDQSGAGNHFTSTGSGNGPALLSNGINGIPAPQFVVAANRLTRVGFSAPATAAEIFIVAMNDAPTPGDHGLWTMGSSGVQDWHPANDGMTYDSFGSTTRKTVGATPTAGSNPHIYGVRGIAGSLIASWQGVDFFSTGTNVMGWPADLVLGANFVNASAIARVGEVLMYSAILSAGDRALVIAYLKARWGIP